MTPELRAGRQLSAAWPDEVLGLLERKQPPEAERLLRKELSQDESSASTWRNLGVVVGAMGRWRESVKLLRRASRLAPEDITILSDLGKALLHAGRVRSSLKVFEQAVARAPEDAEVRVRLAKSLLAGGNPNRALEECDRCPAFLPALRLKGRLLVEAGHFHSARPVWRQVMQSDSVRRNDLSMQARIEWHCGDTPTSLAVARQLMDSGPVTPLFGSMYVSARLHSPDETLADARNAVEEWSRIHVPRKSSAARQPVHNIRPRRGGRRMRIGYVTQEYHQGPAIHFILPLITERNRERFEVIGYHCGPRRDAWTRRVARECDHWREAFTQDELERSIGRDRVDILVDLSGHYGSRMALFQERHAPVQITFPNYPGSTGAKCVDHILTDYWVCPKGNETQYTEHPIWLPDGYLPYRPPHTPQLHAPPRRASGHVTFGLFQRPSKLNGAVWDAIAETMSRVPQSRLLMHHAAADLDDPESLACEHFAAEMESRGISPHRISFQGGRKLKEHLALLAQVDVAFDTFPYNGQTTTCECLWMGVPVVNLRKELHVARVGWQILDRIGCPELVSDSWESYVANAATLARNEARLTRYRNELRPAMRRSALMNGAVVRGIEAAYEGVIRDARRTA